MGAYRKDFAMRKVNLSFTIPEIKLPIKVEVDEEVKQKAAEKANEAKKLAGIAHVKTSEKLTNFRTWAAEKIDTNEG